MKRSVIILMFFIISILLYCETTSSTIYFVQISDTHFGAEENFNKTDKKNYIKGCEKMVNEINQINLPLSFFTITGDIINRGNTNIEAIKSELDIFKKIKTPVYFLPGNNDIDSERDDLKGEQLKRYREFFGDISSKKEINGVVFLFFYNDPLATGKEIEGYDPMKWIEKELFDAGKKPVIIFMHTPPVDDYYEGKITEIWKPDNKEKFEGILKIYNVKAIIAGHLHDDELKWFGNIPVYVAPNFIRYEERQSSYRIYKYENDKLSYFTKYIY